MSSKQSEKLGKSEQGNWIPDKVVARLLIRCSKRVEQVQKCFHSRSYSINIHPLGFRAFHFCSITRFRNYPPYAPELSWRPNAAVRSRLNYSCFSMPILQPPRSHRPECLPTEMGRTIRRSPGSRAEASGRNRQKEVGHSSPVTPSHFSQGYYLAHSYLCERLCRLLTLTLVSFPLDPSI